MKGIRGNLLFVAFYLPLAVLVYFASAPEETSDFTRVAKQFRVMAMRDGKPVSMTLAEVSKPGHGVSFLLPGRVVELPGGDLHKATVLESQPERQLVQYEYSNTIDSISRYRAFRDRVEPVSHRLTAYPALVISLVAILLPAWLLSLVVNWLWGRMAGEKAQPAPVAPAPSKPAPSRFDKAVVALTVAACVIVALFAIVLRFL